MADRVTRDPHTPPRFARALPMLLALLLALPACVGAPGCSDPMPATAPKTMTVTIDGREFELELALDNDTRTLGLGQRTELDPNGGMLFSFTQASRREFVMRDCFIDIDIIFLDATGRVTATHHMPAEPPRGEGEGEVGDLNNRAYSLRLKRYSSRFAAKYAIEVLGGTLEELDVNAGDEIELDTELLDHFTRR